MDMKEHTNEQIRAKTKTLINKYLKYKDKNKGKASKIAGDIIKMNRKTVGHIMKKLRAERRFYEDVQLAVLEGLYLGIYNYDPNKGKFYTFFYTCGFRKGQDALLELTTGHLGHHGYAHVCYSFYAWKSFHLDEPDDNFKIKWGASVKNALTAFAPLPDVYGWNVEARHEDKDKNMTKEELNHLLEISGCSEIEKHVLWNIAGGDVLRELGEELNVSGETIRQYKLNGIKKILGYLYKEGKYQEYECMLSR